MWTTGRQGSLSRRRSQRMTAGARYRQQQRPQQQWSPQPTPLQHQTRPQQQHEAELPRGGGGSMAATGYKETLEIAQVMAIQLKEMLQTYGPGHSLVQELYKNCCSEQQRCMEMATDAVNRDETARYGEVTAVLELLSESISICDALGEGPADVPVARGLPRGSVAGDVWPEGSSRSLEASSQHLQRGMTRGEDFVGRDGGRSRKREDSSTVQGESSTERRGRKTDQEQEQEQQQYSGSRGSHVQKSQEEKDSRRRSFRKVRDESPLRRWKTRMSTTSFERLSASDSSTIDRKKRGRGRGGRRKKEEDEKGVGGGGRDRGRRRTRSNSSSFQKGQRDDRRHPSSSRKHRDSTLSSGQYPPEHGQRGQESEQHGHQWQTSEKPLPSKYSSVTKTPSFEEKEDVIILGSPHDDLQETTTNDHIDKSDWAPPWPSFSSMMFDGSDGFPGPFAIPEYGADADIYTKGNKVTKSDKIAVDAERDSRNMKTKSTQADDIKRKEGRRRRHGEEKRESDEGLRGSRSGSSSWDGRRPSLEAEGGEWAAGVKSAIATGADRRPPGGDAAASTTAGRGGGGEWPPVGAAKAAADWRPPETGWPSEKVVARGGNGVEEKGLARRTMAAQERETDQRENIYKQTDTAKKPDDFWGNLSSIPTTTTDDVTTRTPTTTTTTTSRDPTVSRRRRQKKKGDTISSPGDTSADRPLEILRGGEGRGKLRGRQQKMSQRRDSGSTAEEEEGDGEGEGETRGRRERGSAHAVEDDEGWPQRQRASGRRRRDQPPLLSVGGSGGGVEAGYAVAGTPQWQQQNGQLEHVLMPDATYNFPDTPQIYAGEGSRAAAARQQEAGGAAPAAAFGAAAQEPAAVLQVYIHRALFLPATTSDWYQVELCLQQQQQQHEQTEMWGGGRFDDMSSRRVETNWKIVSGITRTTVARCSSSGECVWQQQLSLPLPPPPPSPVLLGRSSAETFNILLKQQLSTLRLYIEIRDTAEPRGPAAVSGVLYLHQQLQGSSFSIPSDVSVNLTTPPARYDSSSSGTQYTSSTLSLTLLLSQPGFFSAPYSPGTSSSSTTIPSAPHSAYYRAATCLVGDPRQQQHHLQQSTIAAPLNEEGDDAGAAAATYVLGQSPITSGDGLTLDSTTTMTPPPAPFWTSSDGGLLPGDMTTTAALANMAPFNMSAQGGTTTIPATSSSSTTRERTIQQQTLQQLVQTQQQYEELLLQQQLQQQQLQQQQMEQQSELLLGGEGLGGASGGRIGVLGGGGGMGGPQQQRGNAGPMTLSMAMQEQSLQMLQHQQQLQQQLLQQQQTFLSEQLQQSIAKGQEREKMLQEQLTEAHKQQESLQQELATLRARTQRQLEEAETEKADADAALAAARKSLRDNRRNLENEVHTLQIGKQQLRHKLTKQLQEQQAKVEQQEQQLKDKEMLLQDARGRLFLQRRRFQRLYTDLRDADACVDALKKQVSYLETIQQLQSANDFPLSDALLSYLSSAEDTSMPIFTTALPQPMWGTEKACTTPLSSSSRLWAPMRSKRLNRLGQLHQSIDKSNNYNNMITQAPYNTATQKYVTAFSSYPRKALPNKTFDESVDSYVEPQHVTTADTEEIYALPRISQTCPQEGRKTAGILPHSSFSAVSMTKKKNKTFLNTAPVPAPLPAVWTQCHDTTSSDEEDTTEDGLQKKEEGFQGQTPNNRFTAENRFLQHRERELLFKQHQLLEYKQLLMNKEAQEALTQRDVTVDNMQPTTVEEWRLTPPFCATAQKQLLQVVVPMMKGLPYSAPPPAAGGVPLELLPLVQQPSMTSLLQQKRMAILYQQALLQQQAQQLEPKELVLYCSDAIQVLWSCSFFPTAAKMEGRRRRTGAQAVKTSEGRFSIASAGVSSATGGSAAVTAGTATTDALEYDYDDDDDNNNDDDYGTDKDDAVYGSEGNALLPPSAQVGNGEPAATVDPRRHRLLARAAAAAAHAGARALAAAERIFGSNYSPAITLAAAAAACVRRKNNVEEDPAQMFSFNSKEHNKETVPPSKRADAAAAAARRRGPSAETATAAAALARASPLAGCLFCVRIVSNSHIPLQEASLTLETTALSQDAERRETLLRLPLPAAVFCRPKYLRRSAFLNAWNSIKTSSSSFVCERMKPIFYKASGVASLYAALLHACTLSGTAFASLPSLDARSSAVVAAGAFPQQCSYSVGDNPSSRSFVEKGSSNTKTSVEKGGKKNKKSVQKSSSSVTSDSRSGSNSPQTATKEVGGSPVQEQPARLERCFSFSSPTPLSSTAEVFTDSMKKQLEQRLQQLHQEENSENDRRRSRRAQPQQYTSDHDTHSEGCSSSEEGPPSKSITTPSASAASSVLLCLLRVEVLTLAAGRTANVLPFLSDDPTAGTGGRATALTALQKSNQSASNVTCCRVEVRCSNAALRQSVCETLGELLVDSDYLVTHVSLPPQSDSSVGINHLEHNVGLSDHRNPHRMMASRSTSSPYRPVLHY